MCRQLSFDCAIELRRILGREQSVSVFHVVVGVLVPYYLYGHNGTFVVSVYTWQQTKSFFILYVGFYKHGCFSQSSKVYGDTCRGVYCQARKIVDEDPVKN